MLRHETHRSSAHFLHRNNRFDTNERRRDGGEEKTLGPMLQGAKPFHRLHKVVKVNLDPTLPDLPFYLSCSGYEFHEHSVEKK